MILLSYKLTFDVDLLFVWSHPLSFNTSNMWLIKTHPSSQCWSSSSSTISTLKVGYLGSPIHTVLWLQWCIHTIQESSSASLDFFHPFVIISSSCPFPSTFPSSTSVKKVLCLFIGLKYLNSDLDLLLWCFLQYHRFVMPLYFSSPP